MNAFAKTLLCLTWKYSGLMTAAESILNHLVGGRLAVLLFHRVTDAIPEDGLTVSTKRFRQICQLLRQRFRVVSLTEAFRLVRSGEPIPPRTVAITFDDCYYDNLAAAHVLAEFNLPACFFIPTGFIESGLRFEWDQHLPKMPYLTWDDIRSMHRLGFEIGSHTVSHPDMGCITAEEVRVELAESKAVLERQLSHPVRWFAYPFGGQENFRAAWLPLVREAGYEGTVSGYGGLALRGHPCEVLPRQAAPGFQTLLNLELFLSGSLHWYYMAKQRRGLLPRSPAAVPSELVAPRLSQAESALPPVLVPAGSTREHP